MIDSPQRETPSREPLGFFGWIHEAISFISLWLVTRSFLMLLRGIPALAVFVAIPALALWGRTTANQESLKRSYLKAAIQAAKQEDYDAAALWNKKLLTFNPSDREAQFRMALALEEGGDQDRAAEMLQRLTPQEGSGFVPAHFHLATQVIKEYQAATPEDFRSAVWHLSKILQQEPGNMQARDLMVRVQIARGELEEAASHLSKMVAKQPERHLTLAGIYWRLNMPEAAAVQAKQARVHFERLRSQNPDQLEPVLRLAEAHTVTQDFAAAERLLAEHLAKDLDVEATKLALLKLALIEIDVELEKDQPAWPRVVTLLERSLGAFPAQDKIFARVAIVAGRFQGKEAGHLREVLEDALADGRAPAICHLLLGTMLGVNGQSEEAVQHLRAARQVFPNNPVVLNNLAWYLTTLDPPALEEALEHADLAVRQAPQILEIRETRGQILARLGQPEQALPDLEAALRMPTVRPAIHETLADVYSQLGNPEMSARHRQRAAEMSRK